MSVSSDLMVVTLDGKWGFSDRLGNEIVPVIYDNICSFNEGYVAVKRDGKWGILIVTGKLPLGH